MQKLNQHFLQTKPWADFQAGEGNEIFHEKSENFEFYAIKKQNSLGNYLFLPYGPALADKKSLKTALSALKKLAEEQNSIFIRLEPTIFFKNDEMKKLGLKKTNHVEPEHTWVLDLTQTEEEIFGAMETSKVRFFRNCGKKGLSIRTSHDPADFEILWKLLTEVAANDGFQTFDKKYLKNQMNFPFTTLYIVDLEEDGKKIPIAASMMYDDNETRYYAHSGADYEHRKFRAGIILLMQAILDAKAAGRKNFDFWGVTTSENPKHPWYGFTQFKKSFGGHLVTFTGTYDLPVNKSKYRLYSLLRPINKLKRKIRK